MILLIATLQVAGQSYVIDRVCVSSVRNYRVNGESGSMYEWLLTDATSKLDIPIPNPAGTPFTETNAGVTTYGNEVAIAWNKTGTFELSVVQTSLLGCDTTEQGLVEVYDPPTVMAGNPLIICSDAKVGLTTAFATNYSSLMWTSSGDGVFDDPTALHTSYNIGPNDQTKGSVTVMLTAYGKGDPPTCTPVSSTLLATLKVIPKLVINDPPEVCLPTTVDLTAASVTAGSEPGMFLEYFADSLATFVLLNPKVIDKNGTYYIRATSSISGCQVIKPVKVKFTKLFVPNFAPIPEVCLNSTNPPVLQPSDFQGIGGTWSPAVVQTNVLGKFAYKFTPDPGQCAKDTTLWIEVSDKIAPTFNLPTILCQGDSPPSLPSVSANGISGTWNPAAIDPNSTGTFTYIFTPDAGQCGISASIKITINFPGSPPIFTFPPICVGSIPPALPTVSDDGVSGSWNPSVISTATAGSKNYVFTPFSGQCRQPKTQAIVISDKTIPTFDPIGPLCYNGSPVVLPTTSKEGITGTWSPAVVTTNTAGIHTYTFVPAPNWCATGTTMDVEVYPEIKLTITADPILIFGGTTNVTVSATGGSGTYTSGTGIFIRSAGVHPFTVTDDKGCLGTESIVIQNPQDLDVNADVKSAKCAGFLSEVVISVSGGTAPYTFTYTGGDPSFIKANVNTFLVKASPVPYIFVVTDSNGLHGETAPITITDPPGLKLTTSMTQPLCFGESNGTATVTASDWVGTVSYQWDDPLKQITSTATGLKAGNYTVSVTDDCGTKKAKITVSDPPEISLTAVGIASQCPGFDGMIQFTTGNIPDGNYNIIHASGQFNSVTVTGGKASVSAPVGTYTDLKISYNGCISADGVIATVNKAPVQILTFFVVQPSCKTAFGSVFITNPKQNSGFDYAVDNGVFQASTNLTSLTPGVHSIKIRKQSTLCITDTTVTINVQPNAPANPIAIPVPAECETSPIQVLNANKGIVPPTDGSTIIWYDKLIGGKVVASPELNKPGTVTYYAEANNGICPSPGRTPVTLTIMAMPTAPVSSGDIMVCSSTPQVTLDARDAITNSSKTMVWYDSPVGGNVVASPTLNTVKTVTYYAVESNGICASAPRTAVKLTIAPLPVKPIVVMAAEIKCNDTYGQIEVKSPVGPEYVYSMDNGPYQPSVAFNGSPGSHFIRVRNVLTLCESDTTVIKVPAIPLVPKIKNVTTENCICFGDSGLMKFDFENVSDGTYVIIYVGGQFENVKVEKGKAQFKAVAGNYFVLAIEANGCTSNESWNVTITQPDRITVSAVITEIDLKSQTQGAIDISISGGTGFYKTVWNPDASIPFAGATTEDIVNLTNGSYVVSITDQNGCQLKDTLIIPAPNMPPTASNDEFVAGCGGVSGDIVYGDNGFGKDFDLDGDTLFVDFKLIEIPKHGTLILNPDQSGKFTYMADQGYTGIDEFQYVVFDPKKNFSNPAKVTIHVVSDFDCDGIQDDLDPDADGDGILNVDEGTTTTDSDGDGHPNWLDIDADNDGIVDNYEGQSTAGYIAPSGQDTDHDGIDDAYDTDQGGTVIIPVDTDSALADADGIPDFLDVDSDNDWVPDYIEGHDANADGKPDFILSGKDVDADGLDDGFDTVNRYESYATNMTGSNAAMQDFDGDGKKDWRDENDDDDPYLTRFEDLNVDGDYSNDDTDFDGHPEYLDFGRDCDLFVPEAFSPNGDNIHDYFQIYCIEHFPNAKMYIFDQLGNKLFEKEHYGNMEFWGTAERALWDGKTTNRVASVNGGKVIQGTYYYVLQLGNGEVKKSFVFVSY